MNRKELRDSLQHIEEILKEIFDSIRTDNCVSLDSAQTLTSRISDQIKNYHLLAESSSEEMLRSNTTTACLDVGQGTELEVINVAASKGFISRLEKIVYNLFRLINILRDRINKRILFSEKAARELEYLIGSIKYISCCLKDVLVTRNDVLIKYIIDTANAIENTTDNFAAEHEERLLSGVCHPQSSAVFIDLLNAIKENSYHFKEMGRQISSFRRV
jgi:Na+/phosphate symporter